VIAIANMKRLLVIWVILLIFSIPAVAGVGFDAGLYAYEQGDFTTALQEWTPLAEQGDRKSQAWLGVMYNHGKGVPKDNKEALKWYRKAASQEDGLAQTMLGYMYYDGEGVPKDYKEAFKWYRKAASQEASPAQFQLGQMYHLGLGVPKDNKEALEWYRKAASNGLAEAQCYAHQSDMSDTSECSGER